MIAGRWERELLLRNMREFAAQADVEGNACRGACEYKRREFFEAAIALRIAAEKLEYVYA